MNRPTLFRQSMAWILAFLVFISQGPLAYAAEANIWANRTPPGKNSSLPFAPSPILPSPFKKTNSLDSLLTAIPVEAGRVEQVIPPAFPDAPLILIIQDIHLTPEAQTNIAAILKSVGSAKAAVFAGVESAFQNFDFSKARTFSSASRKTAADARIQAGALTGPVYHGLVSEKTALRLFGADDRAEYLQNTRALHAASGHQEEAKAWLAVQSAQLERKKEKEFSRPLREFDAQVGLYRNGYWTLGEFLAAMPDTGETFFPELEAYRAAAELENSLNMERVKADQAIAMEKLARTSPASALNTLHQLGVDVKAGRVSPGDFYRQLKDNFDKQELDLTSFPALDAYVQYVLLSEEIQATRLLEELEKAITAAYENYMPSPPQRRLIVEGERLRLLEKLASLTLTPPEWERLTEQKFLPQSEAASFPHSGSFLNFYRSADRRSDVMAEKIISAAQGAPALLVTGGFHTKRLTQTLRSQGAGVAVVSPRISKIEKVDQEIYLSYFSKEKSPLEHLYRGEKLSLAPASLSSMFTGDPLSAEETANLLNDLSSLEPAPAPRGATVPLLYYFFRTLEFNPPAFLAWLLSQEKREKIFSRAAVLTKWTPSVETLVFTTPQIAGAFLIIPLNLPDLAPYFFYVFASYFLQMPFLAAHDYLKGRPVPWEELYEYDEPSVIAVSFIQVAGGGLAYWFSHLLGHAHPFLSSAAALYLVYRAHRAIQERLLKKEWREMKIKRTPPYVDIFFNKPGATTLKPIPLKPETILTIGTNQTGPLFIVKKIQPEGKKPHLKISTLRLQPGYSVNFMDPKIFIPDPEEPGAYIVKAGTQFFAGRSHLNAMEISPENPKGPSVPAFLFSFRFNEEGEISIQDAPFPGKTRNQATRVQVRSPAGDGRSRKTADSFDLNNNQYFSGLLHFFLSSFFKLPGANSVSFTWREFNKIYKDWKDAPPEEISKRLGLLETAPEPKTSLPRSRQKLLTYYLETFWEAYQQNRKKGKLVLSDEDSLFYFFMGALIPAIQGQFPFIGERNFPHRKEELAKHMKRDDLPRSIQFQNGVRLKAHHGPGMDVLMAQTDTAMLILGLEKTAYELHVTYHPFNGTLASVELRGPEGPVPFKGNISNIVKGEILFKDEIHKKTAISYFHDFQTLLIEIVYADDFTATLTGTLDPDTREVKMQKSRPEKTGTRKTIPLLAGAFHQLGGEKGFDFYLRRSGALEPFLFGIMPWLLGCSWIEALGAGVLFIFLHLPGKRWLEEKTGNRIDLLSIGFLSLAIGGAAGALASISAVSPLAGAALGIPSWALIIHFHLASNARAEKSLALKRLSKQMELDLGISQFDGPFTDQREFLRKYREEMRSALKPNRKKQKNILLKLRKTLKQA